MARILIRPDDLARLARRFDAVSDDLGRVGRRLTRERDEVQLNRVDESFPAAHFSERSTLVAANLRRLAAEFRVDAALMARTVDDADFDGSGQWTAGLLPGFGVGVGAVGGPDAGVGGIVSAVGSWSSVAVGLLSLDTRAAPIEAGRSAVGRPTGEGGLFVAASGEARGGEEFLDRLTERLERSPSILGPGEPATSSDAAGAVWSRIVGELFAADDEP